MLPIAAAGAVYSAIKGVAGLFHKPTQHGTHIPGDVRLLSEMLSDPARRTQGMGKLFGYLQKVGNCSGWGSGCPPMRAGYIQVAQQQGIALPAACFVGGKGQDRLRLGGGCVAPYASTPDEHVGALSPENLLAAVGSPAGPYAATADSMQTYTYAQPQLDYLAMWRTLFR